MRSAPAGVGPRGKVCGLGAVLASWRGERTDLSHEDVCADFEIQPAPRRDAFGAEGDAFAPHSVAVVRDRRTSGGAKADALETPTANVAVSGCVGLYVCAHAGGARLVASSTPRAGGDRAAVCSARAVAVRDVADAAKTRFE